MQTVRAKMKVNNIKDSGDHVHVYFGAVYSDKPGSENKTFSDFTPYGEITLGIQKTKPAAQAFEVGKEYYVDFTPAP